jgi:serine protease
MQEKSCIIRLIYWPMFRYFTLIVCFLVGLNSYGQVHKDLAAKKRTSTSYLPNTLVFKIKPAHSLALSTHKENIPVLNKVFKDLDLTSLTRAFPKHESPKIEKDKLGQNMVDLSLMYYITFKSDINLEEAISKMLKTGMVEYAEPRFIDHILYLPNDPGIQPGAPWGQDQTFYMDRIQAVQAWDVTKGDSNVVVGIVDTGVKLSHPDLKNSIKYNYADPIDGIDNDLDTYVDNFQGWDLGDNDNDPTGVGDIHGAFVSGCSSAQTDNSLGIAGTGFNCKFMPIKGSPNSFPDAIYYGYDGVVYAADHGCDVINLSWGGSGSYSQFSQDRINYAVLVKNAVVVAASGNSGIEEDYYPASYENVLSVGGVDTLYSPSAGKVIDAKWDDATYSHTVDITAQSTRVYSTYSDPGDPLLDYRTRSGTSFACPLVAGAAGLVKSKFPLYTAQQIMEQLRVTADVNDTFPETVMYKEKIGKGRLNMFRAVTETTSPAVRMVEFHAFDKQGEFANAGDSIKLKCKFVNYLHATSNLTVSISSSSSYITFVNNSSNLGAIPTLDTSNNYSNPFTFFIDPNVPIGTIVSFRLGYSDGAYNDYQYFQLLVNPGWLTIDTNKVAMSVGSNSRFGFNDQNQMEGVGFVYKGNQLLFEGGLMVGMKPGQVSDCVRSTGSSIDNDFTPLKAVNYVTPPEIGSAEEVKTIIADTSIAAKIGLVIEQKSYAWSSAPDNKYIIMEYKIRNISGSTIPELSAGLFADWDINNASNNRADYDIPNKLGYVFETSATTPYGGISLLTDDSAVCYSMDHVDIGGNNINPNGSPGFTTSKKITTLFNGIGRMQAGVSGSGQDVSHVIGGKMSNVLNNETRIIAFAIIGGDNITDLRASATAARAKYKSVKTSPDPVVPSVHLCKNDTANVVITPSNGTKFNYYQSLPLSTPVNNGSSYTINNVTKPDTIYVTSKDSAYESNPVPAYIIYSNSLKADFILAPDTQYLNAASKVYLTNLSQGGSSFLWDLGDGTTSTASSVIHHYTAAGSYKVLLKVTDAFGCKDTISKQVLVLNTTGILNQSFDADGISLYPNPVSDLLNLNFNLSQAEKVSFVVFDLLGKEIFSGNEELITKKEFQVDLSGVPLGVYFVKINIGNKPIIRKFIKA